MSTKPNRQPAPTSEEPYRTLWLIAQLDDLCAGTMRLMELQQRNVEALESISEILTRRASRRQAK